MASTTFEMIGGMMRIRYLWSSLILLTCLHSIPTFAELNHNLKSISALSKAYGFLIGQEYTLMHIEKTYPSLRLQVEVARLTFRTSFAGVQEKIEQELIEVGGAANFQIMRKGLDKGLDQYLRQVTPTPEIALQYLEQVKKRAIGDEIEPDVLRYLLSVKYEQAPVAEFIDGFRQRFSTDGSGKARGVKLKLQLPQSWLAQESERPHIVMKWTNEGGTGLSLIMLDIRDAEWQLLSARQIDQLVKSGELRQAYAKLGQVRNVGTLTVERYNGYWIELSRIQERVGVRMYQREILYIIFLRGKTIGITCMSGASELEIRKADSNAQLIKPLCQLVVNSLVLDEAY